MFYGRWGVYGRAGVMACVGSAVLLPVPLPVSPTASLKVSLPSAVAPVRCPCPPRSVHHHLASTPRNHQAPNMPYDARGHPTAALTPHSSFNRTRKKLRDFISGVASAGKKLTDMGPSNWEEIPKSYLIATWRSGAMCWQGRRRMEHGLVAAPCLPLSKHLSSPQDPPGTPANRETPRRLQQLVPC